MNPKKNTVLMNYILEKLETKSVVKVNSREGALEINDTPTSAARRLDRLDYEGNGLTMEKEIVRTTSQPRVWIIEKI